MIKKNSISPKGNIHKGEIPNPDLRFSFKYFDDSDPHLCPPLFPVSYTQTLMQRLKELSSWTIKEFTGPTSKSLRNHSHDWSKTSRPAGFQNLPKQLQGFQGWQFQLSANEHGRVHGIILDHTFYVIWLDKNHQLYP
jgi:hypothetical protein